MNEIKRQKQEIKTIISVVINKINPKFKPLITFKVWWPVKDSFTISLHHKAKIKSKLDKDNKNKVLLYKILTI